jgi:hypothetical protein
MSSLVRTADYKRKHLETQQRKCESLYTRELSFPALRFGCTRAESSIVIRFLPPAPNLDCMSQKLWRLFCGIAGATKEQRSEGRFALHRLAKAVT